MTNDRAEAVKAGAQGLLDEAARRVHLAWRALTALRASDEWDTHDRAILLRMAKRVQDACEILDDLPTIPGLEERPPEEGQ